MQSHRFRDFDAFAASVRGVDCGMMLQNPKTRNWDINVVDVGAIQVQLGRLGSGNIVEGQTHADKYLFYMPLSEDCPYSWNATVLQRDELAILEPGCEFCVSTKHEHDWCTIAVPAEMLVHQIKDGELPACRVTQASRQLARRFRQSVRDVMTASATSPQFEIELAAIRAETALLEIASDAIGERRPEHQCEGRPKVSRQEIIHRSMALLETRSRESVLVGDLASAAGVSERTLRAAFNEYFGVGPIRYLQLQRLHRVHRALKSADPESAAVTDVLVEHGEWEFGRFASRYRRLFGESPSETLHQKW